MSFQDLVSFNKTLLAKQIWRIIDDPESLVAKVLKACYFKHNDIMEATLGSNSSYIWRSMLWSKDILNEGLCWKMGNGGSINSRRDLWIPERPFGRITSNVSQVNDMKGCDLMQYPSSWDREKHNYLFLSYEVEAILKISLSGMSEPDVRYWRFDKKGSYFVKSGYGIEKNCIRALSTGEDSGDGSCTITFWNKIWTLNIPPKARIFIWKTAKT